MSKIRGPTNKLPPVSWGGPERGNPAMTAKRLRHGVKETLNINVVGKNRHPEMEKSDCRKLGPFPS